MGIIFATGPKTASVSKAEALRLAKENPAFPKDADDITLAELDGHWVAAVHIADSPFGGPADETEDSPGPKSSGPHDTAPAEGGDDDGDGKTDDSEPPHKEPDGDEGDGGDGDGPPKDSKGSEKHELSQVLDLLTKVVTALGIPLDQTEGLIPGEEPPGGPPGPDGGPPPPPGAGGPPGGPPGGAGGPEEIHHEKALKPGEVPPGATPVGAPAFAHTNPIIARGEKHPWEQLIGVAATFELEERVPEHYSAADVDAELQEVAYGTGFNIKQTKVYTDETTGHRIAKVLVSAY